MVIKIKKNKKAKGLRGTTTHGWGARKKHKGSGHRGGIGMAGTGKRADHKKTLVNKKYGNKYFGKQGITSKGTEKKRIKRINLRDLERDYGKWKKYEKDGWLDLSEYKILGNSITKKVKIKALDASQQAKASIEKAGGEIEILRKRDNENEKLEVQVESEDDESN